MNALPTKTELATMACCLDWSAPFEIAERRVGYSRNLSIILSRLRRKGWLDLGEANGSYRVSAEGRRMMALSQPADREAAARQGLLTLLSHGMDARAISKEGVEAADLGDAFSAALSGGYLRLAGYETTVKADDWLNSKEGSEALANALASQEASEI